MLAPTPVFPAHHTPFKVLFFPHKSTLKSLIEFEVGPPLPRSIARKCPCLVFLFSSHFIFIYFYYYFWCPPAKSRCWLPPLSSQPTLYTVFPYFVVFPTGFLRKGHPLFEVQVTFALECLERFPFFSEPFEGRDLPPENFAASLDLYSCISFGQLPVLKYLPCCFADDPWHGIQKLDEVHCLVHYDILGI